MKDPDAQGSGSEKGIYLRSRQKTVEHRQGSETRLVNSRGNPETQSASTHIKVEAGKSE